MRRLIVAASFPLLLAAGCGPQPTPVPQPAPVEPAPPPETVENPEYVNWAKFPKGTTVVRRSVTEAAGVAEKTTTTTRYTLTEVTDEYVAVEMQSSTRRYDGYATDNPPDTSRYPRRMALPPGVKKEEFGKPPKGAETGEEPIAVAGKTYPTKWYTTKSQNEAGEVLGKVWMSDEVPGRLLKSVARTPGVGKTTTIEVVTLKAGS